jgi:hypothetical protein
MVTEKEYPFKNDADHNKQIDAFSLLIGLSQYLNLNLKSVDYKNPDTLYFPCEITHEIGLSKNEISFLKKKGCQFHNRKTTINWVRSFLGQRAGG